STETSQVTGGSLDYYQDIGIQLNVVPQISGENSEFINMIIHPAVTSTSSSVEVTASNGNTAIVTYPIINSREAETQVMVKDNETIVIGGLLKDVKTKQEIGVPILKDLPVLGWFFRRNTYDTGKIDLLIFITAKIVKPGEAVTKEDLATNVSLESKK
ncbi:MAG: type II and III secretion system protein, partial [Candidatus Omnitrophica bacterium]|nr:type II and III secretion system protein [Candidatus Omnitrophota bacterium]